MAHFGIRNVGAGQVPTNVSVTNSSTEIIDANAARKWLILTNIGNRDVFVASGQTALVDKGALLGKGGGSIILDSSNMATEAINGIVSGGSATVMILEGL